MGTEAEPEPEPEPESSFTPKLPLLSIPPMHSLLEPSGMLTPPLHASGSVPFRWEEEPGKPRHCTALSTINDFSKKSLELPPRLLLETSKLPSPTTVLEGPYVGRSIFQSSSFRISSECYGSFSHEREQQQLGAMVVSNKKMVHKERGWFGSWGKRTLKGKREIGGGSHVFPSSVDRESDSGSVGESSSSSSARVKITRIRRSASLSSVSHARSDFWATIYGGFKQVVPWSRKSKKDGLVT